MPHINEQGSGHTGPAPLPNGHQYLPYPATPPIFLQTLKQAIRIIDTKIKGYKPCNDAFKALPGGRTLAQIWSDTAVWINFDPSTTHGDYGATRGNNVTITAFTLRKGVWPTTATLVHELAHVGGAPGTNHDAEGTLRRCLLKNLEDPNIIGELIRTSKVSVA